jgi:iron complex transport system ATP-binding protein
MIEIKNAAFSYVEGDIFNNLNIRINEGEIYCLFGPNGCGKSTLIQCILGLLSLSEGTILLNGQDVKALKSREIARQAAYIPQIHEKPFPFKVIDVVLMGRTAYTNMFSIPSVDDRMIAEEALEKVGISEFSERPYTQLSGGETQLVLMARALAQQTPVLIMDEPTAHLDFRNELSFLETVVKLVKATGITTVIATHSPNHAFFFEGHDAKTVVALMNHREITVQGSPSDVLTEANMSDTFNIKSKVIHYEWNNHIMKQIVPLEISSSRKGNYEHA